MNEKAIKICLMTFNIICLFAGVITLAGGLLLQFNGDVQNVLKTLSESTSSTSIGILSVIMLAVGGLITLVSFVGCCGAMSESKCMIGLYCIFLIFLLIGQIVIGALGIVYGKQEIESSFRENFLKFVNEAPGTDRDVLNAVQEQFKCCGFDGPEDYTPKTRSSFTTNKVPTPTVLVSTVSINTSTSTYTPKTSSSSTTNKVPTPTVLVPTVPTNTSTTDTSTQRYSVAQQIYTTDANEVTTDTYYYGGGWPSSCCIKDGSKYINETLCEDSSLSKLDLKDYLHEKGCKTSLMEFINKYALIVGAIALAFAILEIISVIAGCMLYKSLD